MRSIILILYPWHCLNNSLWDKLRKNQDTCSTYISHIPKTISKLKRWTLRTIKFGHHLMISELVWLGVLEWTVYHALIINVDYRAGWVISISTNRSFLYILTYLASQWQLSSTACVPRFALFYWCTWFMKQVLQVSQGYVLYIFKCMIFFPRGISLE